MRDDETMFCFSTDLDKASIILRLRDFLEGIARLDRWQEARTSLQIVTSKLWRRRKRRSLLSGALAYWT